MDKVTLRIQDPNHIHIYLQKLKEEKMSFRLNQLMNTKNVETEVFYC